jgi:hypothetical protein
MKRLRFVPFLLLFLSSCSLFYGSTSSSVPLTDVTIEAQKLSQVGTNPYLYKYSPATNKNEADEHATFVTSVRECGFGRQSPSLVATTRRLLVGLNSIQLHEQTEAELSGHRVVMSSISGRADDQPVELITYSINHKDCVTDVIGWLFSRENNSALDLDLANRVGSIATEVAKGIDANRN